MDELTPVMTLRLDEVAQLVTDKRIAERDRDAARAENTAIRMRACDAHAAVFRAMRAPPAEQHAALQDDGYVHVAVHAVLDGPDGTSSAHLESAVQAHIDALGRRALRAEAERDAARAALERVRVILARESEWRSSRGMGAEAQVLVNVASELDSTEGSTGDGG